jgi:hypothetical protein
VGVRCCYALLAVNLAQAAVGDATWAAVAGLSVFSTLLFLALQTAQLAYLPELSRRHAEVARVSGVARAVELLGVCALVVATLLASALLLRFGPRDAAGAAAASDLEVAVLRARVGQVVGVLLAAPSLLFAWHACLGDRPPAAPTWVAPEGGLSAEGGLSSCLSLWAEGAQALVDTCR